MEFYNLFPIIELFSSIICSNAEVERGFSCMGRIKDDLRNRLTTDSLNDLMIIRLCGISESSYDPNYDINLWNTEGRYFINKL
jgi:hypothetical protein